MQSPVEHFQCFGATPPNHVAGNLERLPSRSAVVSIHPVHGTEEARIVLLDTGTGGRTELTQESTVLFVR